MRVLLLLAVLPTVCDLTVQACRLLLCRAAIRSDDVTDLIRP